MMISATDPFWPSTSRTWTSAGISVNWMEGVNYCNLPHKKSEAQKAIDAGWDAPENDWKEA